MCASVPKNVADTAQANNEKGITTQQKKKDITSEMNIDGNKKQNKQEASPEVAVAEQQSSKPDQK